MWSNNEYTRAEWERLLTSMVPLFIISVAKIFTCLSITVAIEIPVALAQQLLGAGTGADLAAAIPTATRSGSRSTT
jgi:hypothetical protein